MSVLDRRTFRIACTVIAVGGGLGLAYLLRRVILLLIFSVVFAYVISPVVRLAERGLTGERGRSLAIGAVYLVLLTAISTLAALVGPRLVRELTALGDRIPEMSAQIQSGRIIGNLFPHWSGARFLDDLVRSHLPEILAYAQYALTDALAWLSGAWVLVLVPIFAFFLLRDAQRVAAGLTRRFHDEGQRQLSVAIALDLHSMLGQYIRSLLCLCVLTFGVWALLFLLAGVPYALVLAAIGGTLEFLPVLGPIVAGVITIGVGLFGGFAHPWLLAVFVVVWRLLQDYVSSPLIMGRGVELHPGLVIFGVLAGGEIAGPAGMFLSVPIMAGARVVWRRFEDLRRETGAGALAGPDR